MRRGLVVLVRPFYRPEVGRGGGSREGNGGRRWKLSKQPFWHSRRRRCGGNVGWSAHPFVERKEVSSREVWGIARPVAKSGWAVRVGHRGGNTKVGGNVALLQCCIARKLAAAALPKSPDD
jgi:hypothetical protein